MSTTYAGNGTNPTPNIGAATRAAIASSTNASPIVVTYGTAPGYNTGDTIEIEGHQTNTNANGVWQITKQTATTYALNNSAGNGVGGATGYSINYQVTPAVTIPSSGDLVSASSVAVVGENGADFMPWAYRRMGLYRLYDIYTQGTSTYGGTWSSSTVNNTLPGNNLLTNATALFGFSSPKPIVRSGDWLELSFSTTVSQPASINLYIAPFIAYNGGSAGTLTSSAFVIQTGTGFAPVTMNAMIWDLTNDQATFDIGLTAWLYSAGSESLNLLNPWQIYVKHYRQN